jgi:hypothetical protein
MNNKETSMSNSEQHRQIVKKVLDSKAVDFTAIGKVLGDVGPSLALADFDGIDGFCGTMRFFIRILRIDNPGIPVENLGDLGANAGELQS